MGVPRPWAYSADCGALSGAGFLSVYRHLPAVLQSKTVRNRAAKKLSKMDYTAHRVLSLYDQLERDSYARTEDGRLAIVDPREITLYTREGCTLCEEARVAIVPLVREFGTTLREVDIDDDPVLHDRYTNDVPVIFLGSRMVAQHRVNVAQLRRQLEQLPK